MLRLVIPRSYGLTDGQLKLSRPSCGHKEQMFSYWLGPEVHHRASRGVRSHLSEGEKTESRLGANCSKLLIPVGTGNLEHPRSKKHGIHRTHMRGVVSLSLATLAISRALPQLFLFISEISSTGVSAESIKRPNLNAP